MQDNNNSKKELSANQNSQEDFISSLLKVLSHPLAAGLGGFILSQQINSAKTNTLNGKEKPHDLENVVSELKELRKEISGLKEAVLTSKNDILSVKQPETSADKPVYKKKYHQLD